ncbi:hypothetical protein ACTXT7_012512 [Hymenolepis weldensis]
MTANLPLIRWRLWFKILHFGITNNFDIDRGEHKNSEGSSQKRAQFDENNLSSGIRQLIARL